MERDPPYVGSLLQGVLLDPRLRGDDGSYGSHAPAWEPIRGRSCVPCVAGCIPAREHGNDKSFVIPANAGNQKTVAPTGSFLWFPRSCVGTDPGTLLRPLRRGSVAAAFPRGS